MTLDFFKRIEIELHKYGFTISSFDFERPWGGFFVMDESQAQKFVDTYFEGKAIADLEIAGKLSPKILIVKPGQRLSWQYHHRRAEIWRIVKGEVGVITSPNDIQRELRMLKVGETITIRQGERHRLIGLSYWAVIAEIWQHTDNENPSNEEDIVRVEDDFGR
jgi:mannose-6-phosphate isomerase-like protein (cupin superfamily)